MLRSSLAIVVWLVIGSTTAAQPVVNGGLLDRLRGSGVLLHYLLLEQPSVQQELRTTPDQIQAIRRLGEVQRAQLEGLSQLTQSQATEKLQQVQTASNAELRKILSAGQFERLSEIGLQQAGPLVGLNQPEVAQTVGLSPEQKVELRRLRDDLVNQASAGFQPSGFRRGGLRAGIDRVRAAKQAADAKALALLGPEQRRAWDQLQGTPFQGQIRWGATQLSPTRGSRLPLR